MKIQDLSRTITKSQSSLRALILAGPIAALLTAASASAADVTWDVVTGDSLITGGTGAWDTSTSNWTTDAGVNNLAWVNANNDTAIFGGTAGTVTLGTGITVGGLTFDTAGYTVTGDTLTFGTAGNITANADATISSILAGSAITKTGTGTLTLTGANTYTGGTTISAGVLAVGLNLGGVGGDNIAPDGTSTSLGSGDVSVAAGAALHINTAGLTIANNITLNGLSYGVNSGGPAATNSGPWNGALMGVSKTGVVSNTFSGTITLNATSNVSTNWSDKTMIITGKVTGAGGIVFDNNAPTFRQGGLFQLSNTTNDYAGDTTINNGNTAGAQPTLILGASNVIPNGAGKGNVIVLGNLNLNGFSDTINGLSGSGVITSGVAGTPTLTVGDNNATGLTYSGIIQNGSGTVALTKIGTGTQILSGNNTYTGQTTISAGTLQIGAGGTTGTLGSGTVLNNAALTFNRGGQITVGNVISGSGTVTHAGTGNLEITGNNTYGGGTFINSGLLLLRADTGGRLGSGTVTVGSSGGANLLIWAPGAVTLANNFVLNGATGVADRAALNHDGGGGLVTLTGTVTLNATSDIGIGGGSSNNMVISGVVSGAAGAGLIVDEKNVGGANFTLTLSGANTYTGPTTLTGGTLKAGVASVANVSGAFGNNSAVTLSNSAGVKLDITGFATQIGSLTGGGASGGNVTLGAATLTVGGDNTSPAAYAGVISGTGGLTKIGTGTQILSGTNTYTGGTTVNAGTLTFAGSSTGTLGAINVGGGGTTELKIQAGSYTHGGGGFFVGSGNGAGIVSQTGGTVAWNNNGLQLLIGNGGNSGTYNLSGGSLTTLTGTPSRGVMLGVNSGSSATFNLSGTGTLTVAGTSRLMIGRSDPGGTQVNTTNLFSQTGGTATISDMTMGGTSGGAGSGNSATLTLTGGTFTATTFSLLSAANNDVSTINIGGTAVVTLPNLPTARGSGATATINFDGGTLKNSASGTFITGLTNAFIKAGGATFDTSLNGTTISQNLLTHGSSLNGGLTKIGANDLTLSGTNTYTGPTTVSAGRIAVAAATNLSSGATSIVQSGTGQLFINAAATLSNPFNISGTGFLEPGDNQNNRIGAIRMSGGTLSGQITLSGNSRIGTFGTSTNTINGQITGSFGIDFYGVNGGASNAEVFVLSNPANNYTGATTITNSNYNTTNVAGVSTILQLGASNVIPDGASAGNVAFAINGTNNNATVILDLFGSNETINGLTVNAGTFATRITNTAAAANSSLTIGANDTTSSFSGTITDSGAGRTLAITKTGTGNLTLSGTSSYIGGTLISGGTLTLGHATDTLADGGAVNVNGGALALGTNTDTVGAVTLTSGSITGTGAGALTGTSYAVQDGSVGAFLAGSGIALTKTTGGTVTLSGANTYTGATNIDGGTLMVGVSGSLSGSSTVSVNTGGTLGGTGTVGPVTLNGGTLAPGASPGILNTGNVTFSGGTAAYEIFGTTAGNSANNYDQLNVTGTVSFTANTALTIDLGVFNPQDNVDSFTLISNNETDSVSLGGFFTYAGTPLSNGQLFTVGVQDFTISYAGGSDSNDVVISAVPEPGSALMLIGGLATLLGIRRRRA